MLLIFVLILIHILGDFYFQPKKIADNKIGNHKILPNFKHLLIHALIYTICTTCLIPMIGLKNGWNYLIIISIVFISHFLIDGFTCFLKKKIDFHSLVFLIDQVLHIIVLVGIGHLIFYKWVYSPWEWLVTYEKQFEVAVCMLLLIQPSIVFVDIIFSDVDFNRSQIGIENTIETSEENKECDKTGQEVQENDSQIIEKHKNKRFDPGRVIGVAERLMTFVLVLANAYAAIALIITVKTWARQKEIKTIDGFGNKYLIGTLISLAIAIAIGFFCSNIILK